MVTALAWGIHGVAPICRIDEDACPASLDASIDQPTRANRHRSDASLCDQAPAPPKCLCGTRWNGAIGASVSLAA